MNEHAETTEAALAPLLDVHETMAVTRASRTTLWRYVRAGQLVPVRIAGRVLFEPDEIRRFIAARRDQPVELNDGGGDSR